MRSEMPARCPGVAKNCVRKMWVSGKYMKISSILDRVDKGCSIFLGLNILCFRTSVRLRIIPFRCFLAGAQKDGETFPWRRFQTLRYLYYFRVVIESITTWPPHRKVTSYPETWWILPNAIVMVPFCLRLGWLTPPQLRTLYKGAMVRIW